MALQTDYDEATGSAPPGILEVMAAITSCQTALISKIEAVQICLIEQDLDKIHTRLATAEQRVVDVGDSVTEHVASIWALKTKVRALEYRVEATENRSHQNNLCIVGLPEGVEGKNPTVFTEELLRCLLPVTQLSPYFTVEWAHRGPPRPGPEGSLPRTFVLPAA